MGLEPLTFELLGTTKEVCQWAYETHGEPSGKLKPINFNRAKKKELHILRRRKRRVKGKNRRAKIEMR